MNVPVPEPPPEPPRQQTGRESLAGRLREKLPEILIEACSVALAVVLALWTNDWAANRALDADAELLRRALVSEWRSNVDELASKQAQVDRNLATTSAYLGPGRDRVSTLEFSLPIALVSQAAWETAQGSEAARRFDPAWRIEVAKVYELQALYQRQQQSTVDALNAFSAESGDARPSVPAVRALDRQMRTLNVFAHDLAREYRALLAREARPARP